MFVHQTDQLHALNVCTCHVNNHFKQRDALKCNPKELNDTQIPKFQRKISVLQYLPYPYDEICRSHLPECSEDMQLKNMH